MKQAEFAHEFFGIERSPGRVRPWMAILADDREEAERWMANMLQHSQQCHGQANVIHAPPGAGISSLDPKACELWDEEQLKRELGEAYGSEAFLDWQLHARIEFLRFRVDRELELLTAVYPQPEIQSLYRVWKHLAAGLFISQRNQVELQAEARKMAEAVKGALKNHMVGPECFSCPGLGECKRGQAYCLEHPEERASGKQAFLN